MQFVSLDLNRGNGSNHRVGPLSPGLNAICGPHRSGKSSLVQLMQQLVLQNDPSGWPSKVPHSHGTIHLQDERGDYRITSNRASYADNSHYYPLRNGSLRPRVDFRPHRPISSPYHAQPIRLDQREPSVFATLPPTALESLLTCRLGTTGIRPLMDTARELGIGISTIRQADPHYDLLRAEEADLKDRLRRVNYLNHDRLWWERERQSVVDRLALDQRPTYEHSAVPWSDIQRLEDQLRSLQSEIDRLKVQDDTIQRTLADRQDRIRILEGHKTEKPLVNRVPDARSAQLEELDNRLYQWRQTLREIRDHKDRLQRSADDLHLDRQMDLGQPNNSNPREGLYVLESQIRNTQRQLEQVIARASTHPLDRTQLDHSLPATLQSMQQGLNEICQQLTRSDAKNLAVQLQAQIDQLKRCENELLGSVERLIDERGVLLKHIAEEYQIPYDRLSLAVGDWCQCHDHPHLYEWLKAERFPVREAIDPSADQRLLELRNEVVALQDELARCRTRHADELRNYQAREIELKGLRERGSIASSPVFTLTAQERADLQRRLSRADEAIGLWDQHQAWSRRLAVVQEELRGRSPFRVEELNPLQDAANRYFMDLTGRWAPASRWTNPSPLTPSTIHAIPFHVAQGPMEELAMRMALADAIAQRYGRIPLVIDDALEGMHGQSLDNVIQTLDRFARNGQQVILLTADEEVGSRVRAHRGWVCHLKSDIPVQRFYEAPQTNERPVPRVERYPESYPYRNQPPREYDPYEVNRQLTAYANDYETEAWPVVDIPRRSMAASRPREVPIDRTGKQYFLTERSWIEESPSIDADTAAHLRSLGINDVGGLLRSDSEQLAHALNRSIQTIRDWKAQANLMCHVPQLRAFDAKLMVGSGIREPRTLGEMAPGALLQRVQAFLATDRGQDILRSGDSYELARIRSWIQSANRARPRDGYPARPDRDRYEPRRNEEFDPNDDWNRSGERKIQPPTRESDRAHVANRTPTNSAPREFRNTEPRTFESRTPLARRSEDARDARPVRDRTSKKGNADSTNAPARVVRMNSLKAEPVAAPVAGKFYLELHSPIVDAPSIGDRKAEQLNAIGIHTVADFLAQSPSSIAERLADRKVTAETIATWQNQTRLMGSVPNLRGHDAQLLVAAGIVSPDQIVGISTSELMTRINRISSSKEGQRILRGSTPPDLAEIQDWQEWAKNSRTIRAA